jgi:hypothetical protein
MRFLFKQKNLDFHFLFRRTKWRKTHATEISGGSGGKRTKSRNDESIPPFESDSNST